MFQPDSNRQEISGHEDAEFFIGLIPNLENRINTLVQQLKKPHTYITPVDFQAHLQKAKSIDRIDQDWMENFKDVVALKVQGRINIPLIRLAEQLRAQFGGQTIFWLDALCSFAENQKYHQYLRIWQINDAYKTCLHLPIGQYEKNRHFRRLAKHDIISAKKLISSINELTSVRQNQEASKKAPQDILGKVQANYKSHQESSRKVVQFLKNQKQKCLQFFEQTNLLYPGKKSPVSDVSNSWSRKTKERDRPNIPKQKMITDFSVQMVDPKNTQLLKKIVGKDEKPADPQKTSELDRLFNNMDQEVGETKKDIKYLRCQMRQTKSKLLNRPQSKYSNIFIEYSFIEYLEFPNFIESSPFKYFDNPFQKSQEINYEMNDQEIYEEYEADRISQTDSEEDSQDDTLDSFEKRQFYNQDDVYDMDQQDRLVHNTAFRKTKLFAGNQWVLNFSNPNPFQINHKVSLNHNHQLNTDSNGASRASQSISKDKTLEQMIKEFDAKIICPNQTPMPVTLDELDQVLTKEDESKIKQIFHGRSKQQALDIVQANNELSQKFSKGKIRDIISTMTKKRVKSQDGKFVILYFMTQEDKENLSKDQNIEKASVASNNDDDDSEIDIDEPQTAAYDQDYRPGKTVSINVESRSSSQRISNIKSISAKGKQEQKSQSSSLSNHEASVTGSNAVSKSTKREFLRQSRLWSQDTVTNPPTSRLRPRNSKPNYNLNEILNGNHNKDKDVEI